MPGCVPDGSKNPSPLPNDAEAAQLPRPNGTTVIVRILLLCALALFAPRIAAQFDHSHAAWGALLRKHVVLIDHGNASRVRYAGFQADRSALQAYRESLSKVGAAEFGNWTKNQQLAFLINAYNAAAIEKILTRYPDIRSIWDFGKLFGNPFRDKFIRLLGRELSLDNIEHDRIRADGVYNDPRVHFAVNCASIGCPMLREEPYVAERLDAQLEQQTQRFLSDRSRNRFNSDTQTLEVSKIFDSSPWYGGDFRRGWKGYTTLEGFFANYANLLADNPADQQLVRSRKASIGFLEYDWALNAVRP
jgi:hypothetical protein